MARGPLALLALVALLAPLAPAASAAPVGPVVTPFACASVSEDVQCALVAASVDGDSRASFVAVSGSGEALTCSGNHDHGYPRCWGTAMSAHGYAEGHVAASLDGRAYCQAGSTLRGASCLALSPDGDVSCDHSCLAFSATHPAFCEGVCVAASVLEDADGPFSLSGTGQACTVTNCSVGASAFGPARGRFALSGTGDATASCTDTCLAVSGTGRTAGGPYRVSGCELLGVCTDPL